MRRESSEAPGGIGLPSTLAASTGRPGWATPRNRMKQYWARHQGLNRWGVRTSLESANEGEHGAGLLFVWADKLLLDAGSLVFTRDDGTIQGAIAPGHWHAVFEAGPDDSPGSIETPT